MQFCNRNFQKQHLCQLYTIFARLKLLGHAFIKKSEKCSKNVKFSCQIMSSVLIPLILFNQKCIKNAQQKQNKNANSQLCQIIC